jgi:hypothetical protein
MAPEQKRANTANGALAPPPQIMPNLLRMNETQFGGPNAREPSGRKPDGRSQLNRLSPDRQAAVAHYAATHTLPETAEWLNDDSQRSKLKPGLEAVAEAFATTPRPLNSTSRPAKSSTPAARLRRPRNPQTPAKTRPASRKVRIIKDNPAKKMKMTPLAQPAHPSTAQGRIPRCRLKAAFRSQPERRLQAAPWALEEICRAPAGLRRLRFCVRQAGGPVMKKRVSHE